ncbi:MAG TPA: DNA repair protein RecO [Candidatus Dormibacteraeota bacterium]|nr:DNA repair protein RecO [Candidatus Dormibacteraeota bacterium]
MAAAARTYKARGIVLRARNLGEADRIVILFTLEHGKVEAVAKGIRRGRSRVGGRLEFGNEVTLTIHRGRSLDVIAGAEILREHWRELVDPRRFSVAAEACEMIDAFSEPELALPEVYVLLVGMLAAIARSDAPSTLVPRFSMRLLDALGVAPPLDACVRCGNALRASAWVDVEAGGLIDASCRERWRDLPELDAAALENLRALAAPRERRRAAVQALPRVAEAVELLVAHHLGRRPRSAAAVAEMR